MNFQKWLKLFDVAQNYDGVKFDGKFQIEKSQSRKQRDVTLKREEKEKQEFKSNEGTNSKI